MFRLAVIVASLSAVLLAGLLAAGLLLESRTAWRLADRVLVLADKVDRRLHGLTGQPLRGTPDLAEFKQRLKQRGVALGAPVFIRIFKREAELELWLKKGGRFVRFATYPICRWSGRLGPKLKEGDRQSPEGFYTVSRRQLNPNSRWHRSFNLGFPNIYDRAHGRTGSYLMVHGGCTSIGCYAMTNPVIDEIWRLVTASLRNGQPRFHVHAFPFRMTERKLRRYAGDREGLWSDLKQGYDLFEASRVPPRVSVCGRRYLVRPGTGRDLAIRKRCNRGVPTS